MQRWRCADDRARKDAAAFSSSNQGVPTWTTAAKQDLWRRDLSAAADMVELP